MVIVFLISLVAAYLLPATPAATTCGHWLDAATARDRVGWVEITCDSLPCPCSSGRSPSPSPSPERRPRKTAQTIRARVTEVIDGDTIRVRSLEKTRRSSY